jgi:hypothetical protein
MARRKGWNSRFWGRWAPTHLCELVAKSLNYVPFVDVTAADWQIKLRAAEPFAVGSKSPLAAISLLA